MKQIKRFYLYVSIFLLSLFWGAAVMAANPPVIEIEIQNDTGLLIPYQSFMVTNAYSCDPITYQAINALEQLAPGVNNLAICLHNQAPQSTLRLSYAIKLGENPQQALIGCFFGFHTIPVGSPVNYIIDSASATSLGSNNSPYTASCTYILDQETNNIPVVQFEINITSTLKKPGGK